MSETPEDTAEQAFSSQRDRMVESILEDVPFDGWTADLFRTAAARTQTDMALARSAFPRGGLDMALHYHRMGDQKLALDLAGTDLSAMRIRDRITHCVRRRIAIVSDNREAIRRAVSLFSLPLNAPEGMRMIWETSDQIWTLCGDTAEDYNWYTKRAILSSVYSSTVLYWLGDQDPKFEPTWEFLDRRIENVMQFEQAKAQIKKNPLARAAFAIPSHFLGFVRAPGMRATGR